MLLVILACRPIATILFSCSVYFSKFVIYITFIARNKEILYMVDYCINLNILTTCKSKQCNGQVLGFMLSELLVNTVG